MNIIIVNDFAYVNGGAGVVAINTAKSLAARGHTVILFTAVGPIGDELKDIKSLKVICLNQNDILNDTNRVRAIIQGIWNRKSQCVMSRLLKSMSPDNTIIHVHTLSKAISASIIPVIKKRNFKIIFHVHDYGLVCPNMGFFNYIKKEICYKKAMSIDCMLCNCDSRNYGHKLWRLLRQLVQIKFANVNQNIDAYIFLNRFSKNIIAKYITNKQSYILPNTVNILRQDRVKAEDNDIFLFIGRLSPEKNPVIFAEVAYRLGIKSVFVGSGICEKDIMKVNPNAQITGWLSSDDVKRYLKKARVLIFPSLWYEGQPLTILEALAYGVPVIVSDACAGRESINNGINGLWFNSNDEVDLLQKIKILQENRVVHDMSINGYMWYWNQDYNMHKYTDKLESIYQTVL